MKSSGKVKSSSHQRDEKSFSDENFLSLNFHFFDVVFERPSKCFLKDNQGGECEANEKI